jgi:kynurenine formamidase
MKVTIDIDGRIWRANLSEPIDISIPVVFDGPQPNTYDVPKATSRAYETDGWIGDTRRGGSCNFETLTMTPHCNGTHTECVGHLTDERIAIRSVLREALFPATLVSIEPETGNGTDERYNPAKHDSDRLITRRCLESALQDKNPQFSKCLILRTLPNDASKTSRRYKGNEAPYFSLDAIEWIVARGVDHLIVDVPSVDRAFDEGKLSVHHTYWNVPQGTHDASGSTKTITEMVYIPDSIPDGEYLVAIHIPDFVSDAAPSRVWLYRIES